MFSDLRIPGLQYFSLISDLCLVLCCDIYRSTLISIMYPACMITVHDRKSRALHSKDSRHDVSCSSSTFGHFPSVNWTHREKYHTLPSMICVSSPFSLHLSV